MNNFVDEIFEAFKINNIEQFKEKILAFHPFEISEVFDELSEGQRKRLYFSLSPSEIAPIFEHLEIEDVIFYFVEMNPSYIASILSNMDIDDSVDILGSLNNEDRITYLSLLKKDDRDKIKNLLKYEDDTAGSIMTTDYLSVNIDSNVAQATKSIIKNAREAETIYIIYVVNTDGILTGALSLKELILARKEELIKDIMTTRLITVKPSTDQEEVADIFKDYDFSALPVIDGLGRLIGIITVDDIIDVIEEEANDDYSKFAGISDVEIISEKETVLMSVKKRVPWLLVLLLLGFLTSTIIANFEHTLNKIPTIALFMPLILGMAGNTGTQALAVTVRGLNNDQFEERRLIFKHLLRELGTGVLNGLLIGIILFGATLLFLNLNNTENALKITQVVSISIVVSLTFSTLSGALIPIIINSFKIDPAVASGPFVTMINDILALSIYFSLATILILNNL